MTGRYSGELGNNTKVVPLKACAILGTSPSDETDVTVKIRLDDLDTGETKCAAIASS